MRNKLNVQKKMVFRHYWLKDIMPLSKKSILMAALLSLGLVATTDAYAVKGNQTYASGTMADVQSVMQTAKKLTGKVVDAKGESIIGATIKVKGTGQGAISDIDGNFSLPVDTATPTIEISFVGYQTKTVKVTAGTTVLITLDEDTQLLDEVVVVGYGTQKRMTMSSAVATVQGDKIKAPVANVSNQLGGQIPGIITRQTSGEPGKDEATVLLRGNKPLVLVDGIERPWEKVNQADIESISVLKDAAAVAPYGLKGANGVILINTKRGKEGKVTLTYDGSVGFQTPMNIPDFLNAYDALTLYNEALRMDGRDKEVYGDDLLQKYKDGTDDRYKNTDWMDAYMKTTTTTRHNVSLSGGNKFINAFASFGYMYQGSMMGKDTGYDRFNLRSNVDFHPIDLTKVSIDINLAYDTKKSHYYDGKKMMEDLYRLCAPTVPNMVGGSLLCKVVVPVCIWACTMEQIKSIIITSRILRFLWTRSFHF